MSLINTLNHLWDYVAWRIFCGWTDFDHVLLDGEAQLSAASLEIVGIAAIFSNDYVRSEEYPARWRYGGQSTSRQVNVRTYLFDPIADQGMFEAYRDKLKGQESTRTLLGGPLTSTEWHRAIDGDIGLSLRDETVIEDFPKGFLLFGRNITTGELVTILFHHIHIKPWLFWQHFLEGDMLPTICLA